MLLAKGQVLILIDNMLSISSCIPINIGEGYCQDSINDNLLTGDEVSAAEEDVLMEGGDVPILGDSNGRSNNNV
ncbi:hypothetical protein L6452_38963 [Arctium lappa]|uniref:Uncharacterized protein n=1 Tax=Arctium lappa TaxID=4217 RepID=A0ACB8XS73_ARCLA|nr:hypothetical protein L6452_38963 [Arctium lappa]